LLPQQLFVLDDEVGDLIDCIVLVELKRVGGGDTISLIG